MMSSFSCSVAAVEGLTCAAAAAADRSAVVRALNNHGVSLFENGDTSRAQTFFRDSLRLMLGEITADDVYRFHYTKCHRKMSSFQIAHPWKTFSNVSSLSSCSSNTADVGTDAGSSLSSFNEIRMIDEVSEFVSSDEHPASSNIAHQTNELAKKSTSAFVHCFAMRIGSSSCEYSTDELVHEAIVSCMIIFNLALILHIIALEGCNEVSALPGAGFSKEAIVKARSLYHKCILLLNEAGNMIARAGHNPLITHNHLHIDMLTMVLCNNIGHCCYEMFSYEYAAAYYDTLIRMISTIDETMSSDDAASNKIEFVCLYERINTMKSNFLFNAMLLRTPPKVARAA